MDHVACFGCTHTNARTGTPAADSASIHEAAVVAVALATRTRPGMASFVRKEK